MIYPEALPFPGPFPGAPSSGCDADPRCARAACFQVQLEASQPEQAYRQALACAHHIIDFIEALHGWAHEQGLAGGQLTILAIEPAAGRFQAGGASGPKTAALREFAFTTIPLKTIPARPGAAPRADQLAPHREPTSLDAHRAGSGAGGLLPVPGAAAQGRDLQPDRTGWPSARWMR